MHLFPNWSALPVLRFTGGRKRERERETVFIVVYLLCKFSGVLLITGFFS